MTQEYLLLNPDIFAAFRQALVDLPPRFTIALDGFVQGDIPEYDRLCEQADALGYDIQRHAEEILGYATMAPMFVRRATR